MPADINESDVAANISSEMFCSELHFISGEGWLNDPNGLVYYKGEFHLFYQYYPHEPIQGPMHWGHAVSSDLVHWQHLPIALSPDELGVIYSGSAVIDWHNSAGFGREAMVAIFTHHRPSDQRECQSIAYSVDKGRAWTKYAGNPVIPAPAKVKDFRDPKVFWYGETRHAGHWVMLLAAHDQILFFTSVDLIHWQESGRFTAEHAAATVSWETPDLFQLAVDNGPETRWVLTVGAGSGAPAGGSGMQYFIGHFDGRSFTCENRGQTALWADWGADFYAAQSWNDLPTGQNDDGRRIWLAWFNNWLYAKIIPFCESRGMMTLPRELGLVSMTEGPRLVQKPVVELQKLRGQRTVYKDQTIEPTTPFVPNERDDLLEIKAEFQIKAAAELTRFGIRLQSGIDEATVVGYRPRDARLFVDRTRSGFTGFSAEFPGCHEAKLTPMGDRICLHIFLDRNGLELFANEGLVVMSDLIFPTQLPYQIEFFAVGDTVLLRHLELYALKAVNE